jgi:DNA replication protein DnaC
MIRRPYSGAYGGWLRGIGNLLFHFSPTPSTKPRSSRKRLRRLKRQLADYKLLIIDELDYVPLSQTGAELLFEIFSQRYERGSIIVTSNLPFDEWTGVFSSERLTGALLDRFTHHVHILEMNGDSFRLKHSKHRIADDLRSQEPG